MSKQLEGILNRATRATPMDAPKLAVVPVQAPQEPEELLQARIPRGIKRQVAQLAFERGQTVRTFLLESLSRNGVSVSLDQLKDRRK